MANRFWVGGNGTWDGSTATNWSATSGGAGGASVPTAADSAIFDASSNTGGGGASYTVNQTFGSICLDLSMAKPSGSSQTVTLSGDGNTLEIDGSVTMGTGVVIGGFTQLTMEATSGARTITVGAANLAGLNGMSFGANAGSTSASWAFQDTFNAPNCGFLLYNGTFNANGKTITASSLSTTDVGFTRTLTLGAATLNLLQFVFQSGLTNQTYTQGTAIINTASFDVGAGTTLTVTNTVNITCDNVNVFPAGGDNSGYMIRGTLTFGTLTIKPRSGTGGVVALRNNITVSGLFSTSATAANARVGVISDIPGTARTITAASVSLSDIDFGDITAAGAAGTWTGTRIGSYGGNTNITAASSATKYYVGNTAATDAANVWATSSGGSGATNNHPLPQDNVQFDASSFSADGQTCTLNWPNCTNMDFTGVRPCIIIATGVRFVGNLTKVVNVTESAVTGIWLPVGRSGNQFIAQGGSTMNNRMYICCGSTVKLSDDMLGAGTLYIFAGTMDMNNKNMKIAAFDATFNAISSATFNLGSGTLEVTGISFIFNAATLTFNAQTSTIVMSNAINSIAFGSIGAGSTFYKVVVKMLGVGFAVNMSSGVPVTIDELRISGSPPYLSLGNGKTLTVGKLIMDGGTIDSSGTSNIVGKNGADLHILNSGFVQSINVLPPSTLFLVNSNDPGTNTGVCYLKHRNEWAKRVNPINFRNLPV